MAELNWTLEADQWLRDIYDHIAEDNPIAAAGVIEGIYERAQVLLDFPHIGFRYQGSERDIRILLYGHYRIAYLVRGEGRIDILGVFHGALTYSDTLFDPLSLIKPSIIRRALAISQKSTFGAR